MNGLTATVDTYLAAWNARDPARRAELIAEVWSEEGQLIDPPLAAEGRQAISEMAEAMHQHYVDHHFTRVSDVDSHHGSLRFAWQLVGPDGQVTVTGLDVGELAEDGRLARITGFFGELQPRDGG
ncbi:MAG: nuclear transport factor 2 family protein [Solirubrobacteraceae bacterium]